MAPRPPYATDIPDEEYDSPQAQTRRLRQPKPQDPSARSSTYDVYALSLHDVARAAQLTTEILSDTTTTSPLATTTQTAPPTPMTVTPASAHSVSVS